MIERCKNCKHCIRPYCRYGHQGGATPYYCVKKKQNVKGLGHCDKYAKGI